MADASLIEWTDATWNPVRGCSRVSAGCMNCYAERVAMRQSNPGGAYEGLVHQTSQGPKWTGKVRTVPQLLDQPLRWRRPRRIFVNSMSDLFHEDVPDEFIDQIFAMMALSPQHIFQVLTKRPKRMIEYTTHDGGFGRWGYIDGWARRFYEGQHNKPFPAGKILLGPLPHVWLGVSVEDQAEADERIPLLLRTPAAVRWISAEPLLGPLDLSAWLTRFVPSGIEYGRGMSRTDVGHAERAIDWVVAGGESGPKARPSHPDWSRSLRDQCRSAGVPFFFKQWGNWRPVGPLYSDDDTPEHLAALDTDPDEWHRELWITPSGNQWPPRDGQAPPGTWAMRRVDKAVAGRLLDGREWNEYPA